MYVLSIAGYCIRVCFGGCSRWCPCLTMAWVLHVRLIMGGAIVAVLSLDQRHPCGSRAQVTVGIMLAPVMHLTHCASIPLVLLARARSDTVRPLGSTSRLALALQHLVCTATCTFLIVFETYQGRTRDVLIKA